MAASMGLRGRAPGSARRTKVEAHRIVSSRAEFRASWRRIPANPGGNCVVNSAYIDLLVGLQRQRDGSFASFTEEVP